MAKFAPAYTVKEYFTPKSLGLMRNHLIKKAWPEHGLFIRWLLYQAFAVMNACIT